MLLLVACFIVLSPHAKVSPADASSKCFRDADLSLPFIPRRLVIVGDMTGDEVKDVVAERRTRAGGALVLVSGLDGTVLEEIVSWAAAEEVVSWDAYSETESVSVQAVAILESAKRSRTLRLLRGTLGGVREVYRMDIEPKSHRLGESAVILGDFDGDGYAEYALGAPSLARRLLSLPERLIRSRSHYEQQSWVQTKDGDWRKYVDVYREWLQSEGAAPGYVSMRSGRDGREIWRLAGAENAFGFGQKLIATGDHNGDGTRDLLACADPRAAGPIAIICGSTGALVNRFEGLGGAVALSPDLDGDGREDFLFDRELPDIVARINGLVIASGVSGEALRAVAYPVPFGLSGMTAPLGDCDGDGVPDFALCEADYRSHDNALSPAWGGLKCPAPPEGEAEEGDWPKGSGLVVIVSGANYRAVGTVWGCCSDDRAVGTYAARWPDMNGDGVAEVLVTCWTSARVFSW